MKLTHEMTTQKICEIEIRSTKTATTKDVAALIAALREARHCARRGWDYDNDMTAEAAREKWRWL